MEDPEDGSLTGDPSPEIDQWDRLLKEQTALFWKTTSRNKELEARVEDLERELNVWKIAQKAADEEKSVLNKKVYKLERSIGSIKEDNPMIMCFIDGDGNIFTPELIRAGQAGGRKAAMLLRQGLSDHLSTLETDHSGPRGEIWLNIYCNKKGLTETLANNDVCTAEQFEQFVMGFNQAAPLFSFVDVGIGKEAADSKIKECLRVFTRFPQTTRVFFGGAHDNGYTSTLNYLSNEGLHHKLTILRGYQALAQEVRNLNLPTLEIDGLFLKDKLQSTNYKKPNTPATPTREQKTMPQVQDFDRFRNKNGTPQGQGHPARKSKRMVIGLAPHKHKPAPCNFYYLATCKHGDQCRYSHDWEMTPAQLEELRINAKKWPCPHIRMGKPCEYGNQCCGAHWCPRSPKCPYAKAGKCAFPPSMHVPAQAAYEPSVAQGSVRSHSPVDSTYQSPGSASSDAAYDDVPAPSLDWSQVYQHALTKDDLPEAFECFPEAERMDPADGLPHLFEDRSVFLE